MWQGNVCGGVGVNGGGIPTDLARLAFAWILPLRHKSQRLCLKARAARDQPLTFSRQKRDALAGFVERSVNASPSGNLE